MTPNLTGEQVAIHLVKRWVDSVIQDRTHEWNVRKAALVVRDLIDIGLRAGAVPSSGDESDRGLDTRSTPGEPPPASAPALRIIQDIERDVIDKGIPFHQVVDGG